MKKILNPSAVLLFQFLSTAIPIIIFFANKTDATLNYLAQINLLIGKM